MVDLTTKKQVIVLGAGASGLATAYWLFKNGYDVIVLEKNAEAGGSMESVRMDGYMFDKGPNSGLEITPLIKTLVNDLNLADEMVYANDKGDKRYILRDGELHQLPMNPYLFLKSKLFSTKGKLRLLLEPFIGRSNDGYYQSISEFVARRFGKEFLDYAINPFVAGVYAGRPDALSVKSSFPKLYELEEKYGGVIVGTIRGIKERKKREETSKQSAKMFSFIHGMQSLPKAIAARMGERVFCLSDITNIAKTGDHYAVSFNNAGVMRTVEADCVISTLPAYTSSKIFSSLIPDSAKHFDSVYYPPVLVLLIGFKQEDIKRPLDGFGFLIPEAEKKTFLGAIWSSVLFPARAPKETECFTLFIGGSRNADLFEQSKDEIIKKSIAEFKEIMKIEAEPEFVSSRFWQKSIPQYNLGYIEKENYFDNVEKEFPGLLISGNFRRGISVGDCIKNSEVVYTKAAEYLAAKK